MSLHKLTAGDGYTYLTRQVAALDSSERGHSGLADYYAEKGESPGRWWGAGLAGLGIEPGAEVTEAQMKNLFGEGRHPDAERLEDAAIADGRTVREAERASRLGRPFAVYEAAGAFQREVARRFVAHNLGAGEHWRTPVPAEVRARIRTAVAEEMFAEQHGRAPLDDRERAGFLAQASRQQTTAVAGYDLAFTPVKSVSVLWALADPDVAKQVEEAHHAAVEKTLAFLEAEVLFTRRGRGGVQQVKATGLIAALFTHRDARSGDPNLHTHVAISNKVQDASGAWLAVDGRVLYKANVTLSETYNTLIEAELAARLGVRFAARDTANGKQPVREVVGIDARLAQAWSRRASAIEGRRRELAVEFQARHGRPSSPTESYALAQRATVETRQAKHAPRSEAEQRAGWRAEAVQVLGSPDAIEAMVDTAFDRTPDHLRPTDQWAHTTARRVVETVQARRATWQVWHLRAEAQRRAREAGIALRDLEETVEKVVAVAIRDHSIAFTNPDPLTEAGFSPAALTRPDGTSVYTVHGSQLYTSAAVLDAERRLVATARQAGGRAISDVRVGIALAEAAANGRPLNTAQAAMVRELATSGARLQLALAPAGTGKTTAMEVLARAWRDSGGSVLGLAPSAVAAQELREAVGGHCDTLAKLDCAIDGHHQKPDWVDQIDGSTLVVIDEAGMASTTELEAAVAYVTGRGGSVRLVGDDRQLASVGAGGVLRDIATTAGAVTLTEVVRFRNPDGTPNTAEAAATLAVRDGEVSALGFYADQGRIHVGDLASAADQAYRAWAADMADGKHSLLLAPTRELVAELNSRARRDRLTTHPAGGSGPVVRLGDGTSASAGDTIVSRRNDRRLRLSATDWVKNGDRWTITAVHADGTITARHQTLRRTVRLPQGYVSEHVQLGYAATIHGGQGMSVDTSHTVLTGDEDRSLLYVALSRGRARNDLYLTVGNDGDPHTLIRPETLVPPTALDQLAQILGRDGAPISATSALREVANPARQLHDAAARYHDAVTFAAEHLLGEPAFRRLQDTADALQPGLSDAPAWATLRCHLALRALDGADPVRLLTDAVRAAPMTGAADPAAVLDARLGATRPGGPLPWLPGIPSQFAQDHDWGNYLAARHEQVTDLARTVEDQTRDWTTATAPDWAHPFLASEDERLRAALAVWRAVHDIADTDHRPTGARQIGDPGAHQRALDAAVRASRPSYPFAQRSWYQALPEPVRPDPWITPLCQRLARLEHAGLPVATYLTHALDQGRPLPDQHSAAALWFRLVPHLGPAALHGDQRTGDLLHPEWLPHLEQRLEPGDLTAVKNSPAWPALVAAVDEACHRHDWAADELLASAFHALPTDLADAERCEALVLRVALLTDPPKEVDHAPALDPEDEPPADLDQAPTPSWIHDLPVAPDEPARGTATAETTGTPTARISRARYLELHERAMAFYADCYPKSWAPAYLRSRLGTDLADHPDYTIGYAPPGPTTLIRYLLEASATLEEVEAAGLARRRDRGDFVDAFRDRLVMPIRDNHGAILGFIGRRNPNKNDDDYAGPKYLNTRTTDWFTKAETLFGLAEARPALEAGALPVIVEGPLDAYAIAFGSNQTAVGIAPMGTALTHHQIGLLRRYFTADPSHIAVATDADPAGWKAAQVAYWNLTAADADPTYLNLADGLDPANLLQTCGPDGIQQALHDRSPLGDALIAQLLRRHPDWTAAADRLTLIRETGKVIATRPASTWPTAIHQVTRRLQLSPGILEHEVLHHSIHRDHDAESYAATRISENQTLVATRERTSWPTPTGPLVPTTMTPPNANRSAGRPEAPDR